MWVKEKIYIKQKLIEGHCHWSPKRCKRFLFFFFGWGCLAVSLLIVSQPCTCVVICFFFFPPFAGHSRGSHVRGMSVAHFTVSMLSRLETMSDKGVKPWSNCLKIKMTFQLIFESFLLLLLLILPFFFV